MTPYFKALSLVFFLSSFTSLYAQTDDLYNVASSRRYAQHLYSSENFTQAAIEYERLILIDSARAPEYQLQAVRSYRQGQKLEVGFKRVNEWFSDEEKRRAPINKEFSLYLIGLGYYNDALAFLEESEGLSLDDKATLTALSHAFLAQWTEAVSALEPLQEETTASRILKQASLEGLDIRFKKPGLAAVLSIVPGLGRVYTGNYADAGISALTITTIAWQSYTGFDKNGSSSFYGWLTATLATAFYLGNIYGSYRSAQLYNKQKMDALYAEVLRAYKLVD